MLSAAQHRRKRFGMKFRHAFDVVRGDVVAFVGAGGKTSALVGLGYELAEAGWRVLATTTTALADEQLALFPRAMPYDSEAQAISRALSQDQFVLLYDRIQRGSVYGPALEWTAQLLDTVDSDVLLVEADAAHGLPFKAPLADEPRIPPGTSLVVAVASLAVLGKPLNAEHVYNPQAMIERYGFVEDSPVKSPWLAQVLRDGQLGLKDVPKQARVMIFLNQTPERGYLRGRARLIARLSLQSEAVQGVALGAVRAAEPVYEVQRTVGALVLADGAGLPMQAPKALLPWGKNRTIIAHIAEQLIRSRLQHIHVVSGLAAARVKAAVEPLGIKVVHNRAYRRGGMLSSLQAGLRAMPKQAAAALIVRGDQPRMQPKVVYQLLTAYARSRSDLLIPSYRAQWGHPMLISRRYWHEIMKLPKDGLLSDFLRRHSDRINCIPVDTDSVLGGVDTAADYQRERQRAGLKDRSAAD